MVDMVRKVRGMAPTVRMALKVRMVPDRAMLRLQPSTNTEVNWRDGYP